MAPGTSAHRHPSQVLTAPAMPKDRAPLMPTAAAWAATARDC
jgi:hypothetical protein